jgi:dipeptidyl aminopeptidase/acylaminoacyl peptidase
MSESKRLIQPEDLFKMEFLQGAALSPDGKKVVYALSYYDKESDSDKSALWLVDLESGEAKQMTTGEHPDSNPSWSPDGKSIGFMSTRNGAPQLYSLPVDGGEATQLTTLEQGVREGPVWSPDGKHIAFTAGYPPKDMPDLTKPYRVTRSVYRFDGMGMVDPLVQNVYVMEIEGGEPKQLSDDDYLDSGLKWSPDSRQILYSAMMSPDRFDGFMPTQSIVTLDGEITRLWQEWGTVISAEWLPDGKHLAFMGTLAGKPIGTKSDLWLAAIDGGEPVNRTANIKVGVGGGLQPDMPAFGLIRALGFKIVDDNAYIGVQEGGEVHICRIALSGDESCECLVDGERANLLVDVHPERMLFAVSTLNNPLELHTSDLDGSNQKQLTNVNTEFFNGIQPSEVEHLLWDSIDGTQAEGWYLKPPQADGPYPTVLYIHGGPHSAYGHIYSFDFQMLNGAGYGVLVINHRASTGYGDEFSTGIFADWGNLDYHDLMTGVDYAIEQGLADADKLGVCGISGGGNLSCWIVGQTDRFKAAIPENPVTNWVSMYGTSDLGVYLVVLELGGHPHEIPEVYAKCSPITYAHKCTTPTLLVQGDDDFRCPAEQSEQFYNVLRANDCIVEMLRLPNSPHVGSIGGPPALRRAQNDAMLEWFDRYILGKEREIAEEEPSNEE